MLDRDNEEVLTMAKISLDNALKDPNLYDGEVLRSGKSTPAKGGDGSESVARKKGRQKRMDAEATVN